MTNYVNRWIPYQEEHFIKCEPFNLRKYIQDHIDRYYFFISNYKINSCEASYLKEEMRYIKQLSKLLHAKNQIESH